MYRRLWIGLLVVGALLLVPACARQPATAPATSITVVAGPEPGTLDPQFAEGTAEYPIIFGVMEGLFAIDKDWKIVPVLAESYRLVDDLTWEFRLKRGIKFHNGEPFTAEAVKATYERSRQVDARNRWADDINLDRVEIIDDYTFRFITKAPTGHLLARIANDHYIFPPNYIRTQDPKTVARQPIGTGPYKFKEWVPGERVVLEANREYWGGAPKIQQVVFRFIPEASTRIAELLAGNVDLIYAVPPDQVKRVEDAPGARIVSLAGGRRVYLGLRTAPDSPFKDKRVRQAMNYGINVEGIINSLYLGTTKRMRTPVNPPCDAPDVQGYSYNPERAKQLLAEAGYAGGLNVTLDVYEGVALGDINLVQAIAISLRDIGVNVRINVLERSVFVRRVRDRTTSEMYLRSTAPAYDCFQDLLLFRPDHAGNATLWAPPEFVQLYQRLARTLDPEQRRQLSFQLQRMIVEEAPWVFLFNQPDIYGVRDRLKGFEPHGDERIRLGKLWVE